MTASSFFIVLLRVLGFFLVAVYGSRAMLFLPAMLTADRVSAEDFVPVAVTAQDAFLRQTFFHSALVAAFGLYALFGGKALLRLGPVEARPKEEPVALLNTEGLLVGMMRIVGLVLLAMHLPTLLHGVYAIVRMYLDRDPMTGGRPYEIAYPFFVLVSIAIPPAVGVYLVFGGGWIVRRVAARPA